MDTLMMLVYLFWGAFGLAVTLLLGFTTMWVARMPKNTESKVCEPTCWVPIIMPWTWSDTQYRCKECGTDWCIEIDLDRPRGHHLYWVKVAKERKANPRRTGETSGGPVSTPRGMERRGDQDSTLVPPPRLEGDRDRRGVAGR